MHVLCTWPNLQIFWKWTPKNIYLISSSVSNFENLTEIGVKSKFFAMKKFGCSAYQSMVLSASRSYGGFEDGGAHLLYTSQTISFVLYDLRP